MLWMSKFFLFAVFFKTHLLYLNKSTAVMRIKKRVRSPHTMYSEMEHWQPKSDKNRRKMGLAGFTSLYYDNILFTHIPLQEHPIRYITQVHIKHITFHIAVTHGLRMNILKVSKFTHQLISCWYSYECILMWFGCCFWFNCLFTPRPDRVSTYCLYAATSMLPFKEFHESPSSLVKHRWNHCSKVIMGQWHIKMSKMMKRKHKAIS